MQPWRVLVLIQVASLKLRQTSTRQQAKTHKFLAQSEKVK